MIRPPLEEGGSRLPVPPESTDHSLMFGPVSVKAINLRQGRTLLRRQVQANKTGGFLIDIVIPSFPTLRARSQLHRLQNHIASVHRVVGRAKAVKARSSHDRGSAAECVADQGGFMQAGPDEPQDATARSQPFPVNRAWAARSVAIVAPIALTACQLVVLDPQGPIGFADKTILLDSLAIMLAIVIPTIVATLAFAWWFRASNTKAQLPAGLGLFRPPRAHRLVHPLARDHAAGRRGLDRLA